MANIDQILEKLPLLRNRYQWIVVTTVAFLCFRGSLQLYGISFIAHTVPHTCQLPENKTSLNASSCYYNDFEEGQGNVSLSCSDWSYGPEYTDSHSIVTQWDLVCSQSYFVPLDMSIYLAGQMIGGIFLSPLSDKYGRRPFIIYGLLVQLVFEIVLVFSVNIYMFIVFRFFVGSLKQVVETAAYTLLAEWFSTRDRTLVSNTVLLSFGLGIITLAGIAAVVPEWRYLILIYNVIPDLVVFPLIFVLPESLFFLDSKKRHKEVEEMLSKVMPRETSFATFPLVVNKSFNDEQTAVDGENQQKRLEKDENLKKDNDDETPPPTMSQAVRDLFSSCRMLSYSFALFWLSISLNLTYFVMTMNTMSLSGNEYANFAISGAIEMPFVLVTALLSIKMPRLLLLFVLYAIAGVNLVVSVLLPVSQGASIVAFFGRGAIAGAYIVQILYAAEMFPTVVRNAGIGLYQIGENLGPLVGPAILAFTWAETGPTSLYFILGLIAFINAVVVSLMPETAKQPLPETVADIEARPAFSVWRCCSKSSNTTNERN